MIFDIRSEFETGVVATYLDRLLTKGSVRVGLTTGVFDLAHAYHVMYLRRCRGLCDLLAVGVDSDDMVRAAKGDGRPITNEQFRLLGVDALKPVDLAFAMNDLGDLARAGQLFSRAEVLLFKNQTFGGACAPKKIVGLEHGARLVIVPDLEVLTTTTEIIEHLKTLY